MSQDQKDEQTASERRGGNKATMDQPQEEFVADQSVPSRSPSAADQEHGDEVEHAKRENEAQGHTHSGR